MLTCLKAAKRHEGAVPVFVRGSDYPHLGLALFHRPRDPNRFSAPSLSATSLMRNTGFLAVVQKLHAPFGVLFHLAGHAANPRASVAHQRFLFNGEKTCIDCHKGIARHLPDMRGVPGWQ
jgi:hypothetical protein